MIQTMRRNLTGVLKDRAAMTPVQRVVPKKTDEQRLWVIRAAPATRRRGLSQRPGHEPVA